MPKLSNNNTDFLEEDLLTSYVYIFGILWYLHGYDANAGSYILGYIKEPTDVDGSTDPVLSEHANELTIAISTWIAWGLDRQYDRQREVGEQISQLFGVQLGAK